jgi:hypothetical protein
MVEIEQLGPTSIRIGVGKNQKMDLEAMLAQEPATTMPKKDELPTVLNMVGHYVREYFVQNAAPPQNNYLFWVASSYTPDFGQQKELAEYGAKIGAYLSGIEMRMNASARMHLRSFLKPSLLWQLWYGALAGALLGYAADNVPAGIALGTGYALLHRAGLLHGSHAEYRRELNHEIRIKTGELYDTTLKRLERI